MHLKIALALLVIYFIIITIFMFLFPIHPVVWSMVAIGAILLSYLMYGIRCEIIPNGATGGGLFGLFDNADETATKKKAKLRCEADYPGDSNAQSSCYKCRVKLNVGGQEYYHGEQSSDVKGVSQDVSNCMQS